MKRLSTLILSLAVLLALSAQTSTKAHNQLLSFTAPQKHSISQHTPSLQAPQAETIEWVASAFAMHFYTEDMDWCYTLDIPNKGQLQLDIYTGNYNTIAGQYSSQDGGIMIDHTALFNGSETLLTFVSGEATITAPDGRKGVITIDATLIGDDGNTYHISATKEALPTPNKSIHIETSRMLATATTLYGVIPTVSVVAEDDNYFVQIILFGNGDMDYHEDLVMTASITDKTTGNIDEMTEEIGLLYSDLSVYDNVKKLKGEIIFESLIAYTFDLSMTIPDTHEKTIQLHFNEAVTDANGTGFLIGAGPVILPELTQDAAVYIDLAFFSPTIPGTYTIDDVDYSYTQLYFLDPIYMEEMIYNVPAFYDIKAEITQVGGDYVCHAQLWGFDNILYDIVLNTAPTALDQTEDHTTQAQKILTPDGQIYILRNGHTYTTTGIMLK